MGEKALNYSLWQEAGWNDSSSSVISEVRNLMQWIDPTKQPELKLTPKINRTALEDIFICSVLTQILDVKDLAEIRMDCNMTFFP